MATHNAKNKWQMKTPPCIGHLYYLLSSSGNIVQVRTKEYKSWKIERRAAKSHSVHMTEPLPSLNRSRYNYLFWACTRQADPRNSEAWVNHEFMGSWWIIHYWLTHSRRGASFVPTSEPNGQFQSCGHTDIPGQVQREINKKPWIWERGKEMGGGVRLEGGRWETVEVE